MPTFTGGLVGYFSYDYIKYSEPKLKLTSEGQQDFRDMDLMLFNEVIAFDHYRQKIMLITGVMTEDIEGSYKKAEETLEDMAKLIREGEKETFPTLQLKTEIEPVFPKEQYCDMVEKAKQYIREGDIFQVVLSDPMKAELRAVCSIHTGCSGQQIRRRTCFIFPATIWKSPALRRRHW